jgi:hypothetical protein
VPVFTGASIRAAAEPPEIMWVIFLEAGVALALLLLIVWWTWPRKDKSESKDE